MIPICLRYERTWKGIKEQSGRVKFPFRQRHESTCYTLGKLNTTPCLPSLILGEVSVGNFLVSIGASIGYQSLYITLQACCGQYHLQVVKRFDPSYSIPGTM